MKNILAGYEINSACGDLFYGDAIGQHLRSLGIEYQVLIFNSHTRAGLFSNLKHLLAQKRIELLDNPELLRQLRNLRQEQTSRGQIDVRPSPGMNDDLAVAVALAANQLCKQPSALPPIPFEILNQNPLGLVPADCTYQTICDNFPTCMDEDLCMGFKMNDLGRHSTIGGR